MQVACDTEPKRNDDGMAGRQRSPSFTQREQIHSPQSPILILAGSVQQVNMDNGNNNNNNGIGMKMYLLPPSFACVTLCHTFHANSSGCCFSLMRTINENKQPQARQQHHKHTHTYQPNMYIFIKAFLFRNHFSGHLNEHFLV